MKKNIQILSIAIVVVLIAGAGLFFSKQEQPKEETVPIKMIDSTTTVYEWDIIKKLTGEDILKEEGVKLELISSVQSTGGVQNIQAMIAKNIDYGGAATSVWLNAISQGGKIKAVVGTARTTKERPAVFWAVLNDSNIYSVEDFKDKKIATNILGAYVDYHTRQFLKEKGMSINQVQLVVVPQDQQEQMLRSKQVDVAALYEKYYDAAKKRGDIRVIVTDFDLLKKENVKTFGGFREDFIKEHPDDVRRFVTAYEKSQRLVWDEYKKDPQKIKKIAGEIITEKGGNPKAQDYQPIWSPSAPFIKDEDVQLWIDWFIEDGILKPGQLKPSDVYTNEFNPYYK
ncbi:MAG TPA: ABC transporter substrate-binding protein [Candidatus Methanoperedens sp.]